jgi:hypothetical protein
MVIILLPFKTHATFKSAKVTLIVVGEDGVPLEGVDAGIGFEKNTGWGTNASAKRGLTDADGRFTATGKCNGHIGYGARKEGFYRSHLDYDFKNVGAFGWEPWNPELKIVMRKIENPVAMYARDVKTSKKKIELPVLGQEVGFDLEAYDWVAPYGVGKTVDFIFNATKSVRDKRDFDVKVVLSFPNKGDGIVTIQEDLKSGSEFKLPRFAPEAEYATHKLFEEHRRPEKEIVRSFEQDDSYVFRVRSTYKDGKLVKAKYGKIHGPIFIDANWTKTVRVYLKYYFNPDGTRNLEFDVNRNLFENLSPMERVGIK